MRRLIAKTRLSFLFSGALLALIGMLPAVLSAQNDSAFFTQMKARSIGPAGMSGRIAAVDAVHTNPDIIWAGAAIGGVWKSTNGGQTWATVFDYQNTSAIGALTIQQSNPQVVWVGTGESNVRNSTSIGRGVFKTLDGGKTWKFLGLEKTERISRIILDPNNPDIAFVAALGPLWSDGTERGVFKTTDGGKTWKKVLYVNEKTGAADLAIHPTNPNILICSMWEHRRQPWFFNSGGKGSGVYFSADGGETWTKQSSKDGLPEGDLGRAGIAFAPSNPGVVYALVEAKESALLRSDDGGYTWRTQNKTPNVNPRPFYFCDIRVHPKNENTLFRLQVQIDISIDAGKTFQMYVPDQLVHADHHALYIHPNGDYMINGNDGGVYITRDGGKRWQFVDNIPLAQFYHVHLDNQFPYYVYGGLQDNGSWRGPSTSLKSNGIYNGAWEMVNFGDGFATVPDPENNEAGYAMSQGGALSYFNLKGGRKSIRPTESSVKHRYNWNAAIALDPFDTKTVYYGSQFLHRSPDKGTSWEIISPDLTTNDTSKQLSWMSGGLTRDVTAAENYCTLLSIAPSPKQKGVIWVGTDDGNVQLTKDGGKTWSNVSTAIINNKKLNVPPGMWVPCVEASPHDAATAFVVFDDHRRGNQATYVFVTRDFGATWTSLNDGSIDGYCHAIRQDPVQPNLLFLGTEFGLYVSMNGGSSWSKWKNGIPTVPVYDMAVHPRDHDLVIATHGRGLFILDDIRPLRELTAEKRLKEELVLFSTSKAYQWEREFWAGSYVAAGSAMYRGESRRDQGRIQYMLNPPDSIIAKDGTPREQRMDLQILKDTTVIRTFKGTMKKGINIAFWDLNRKGVDVGGDDEAEGSARVMRMGGGAVGEERPGLPVLPGTYTVRIKYNGKTYTQPIEVSADPRINPSISDLQQRFTAMERGEKLSEATARVIKQINEAKKSVKGITDFAKNITDKKKADALTKSARTADKQLDSLLQMFVGSATQQGIFDSSTLIQTQVSMPLFTMRSAQSAPTQAALVGLDKGKAALEKALIKVNGFMLNDIATLKKQADEVGLGIFTMPEEIKIRE